MKSDDHRSFKDGLFQQLARISKAFSNPRRLELVDLLAQSERTVDDLAGLTGMSIANASQHLQVLRGAMLVQVRREGSYSYYRLATDDVFRLWQSVRDLGRSQFAEIDRLLQGLVRDRDPFRSIGSSELLELIRRDDVVVLDVRPATEFRAGHVFSARSVPVDELERRLKQIPKGREIVAYCRGPFCVYADEAVALLRRNGYKARRLDVGFPDWRAAGLPVGPRGESA